MVKNIKIVSTHLDLPYIHLYV